MIIPDPQPCYQVSLKCSNVVEFEVKTFKNVYFFRFLTDVCERRNIPISAPLTVPRLLDKLLSALVEPNLVQPTFITHHPMVMSPLSRPSPTNPAIAERFELYAAGLEICNAYSELNDPEIQRRTLLAQVFTTVTMSAEQKVF